MTATGPVPDLVDLRLVPAVLAAWSGALVVVALPPVAAVVAGAVLGVTAGGLVAAGAGRRAGATAGRGRRRHVAAGGDWRGLGAAPAARRGSAVLALAVAAAVLVAGAAHGASRASVVRGVAAADVAGTVRFEGRVAQEPAPLPPAWPGAPERSRVLVAVDRAGGQPVSGQVVVLGPETAVAVGDRVTVTGAWRPLPGTERAAGLVLADEVPRVRSAGRPWDGLSARLRDGVEARAAAVGPAAALLPGLAVGRTARLDPGLRADLRTAGLTHLTAVSGAHFTLVTALLVLLVTLARGPRGVRVAAAVVGGAALLLLVHASPSVVRAAAMGAVGVAGLATGRPARAPAALATACVGLLLADPWLARDVGMALSAAATAALVLLAPPLVDRWEGRLGRGAAAVLAVPVAAQLACGPLVVVVGGGVATYGVPANVVAAPAVAPATVLGLLTALLDPVAPGAAAVTAHAGAAATWWIAAVARTVARLPGAELPWLPGPAGVAVLLVASAAAAALLLRPGRPGR
ncbi:ComEC/Rec2 family competence protein [Cellulomonas endophytica]|uniref:ComEC/Rec2 family competence protein n=1 Tax=Cellulomonas endophytica TaxID=2494735 RepID=UPI001011F349|nr:ComEC/Rec2 family competence protein [Cellulomonas endophytica]